MGGRNSRPRKADTPTISIIVPTLVRCPHPRIARIFGETLLKCLWVQNEERHIADAVTSAFADEAGYNSRPEVLVVDGGSTDQTIMIAKRMGAKVVCSQPGRARQMNLGWQHSKGDCLLFLHADCKLPQRYRVMLHAAMYTRKANSAPSWGCFETIDADVGCGRQLLKQAVRFRTRHQHMPYGDQGLFVTSKMFRELGGFKDLPIMEDYELVSRLRKHGPPAIIPHAMQTSGRRWQSVGFLQTTLTNQAIILAYHCGVPVSTLASWYRQGMR